MSLKELRVCDVYGTTKDVQHYKIIVVESDETIIEEDLDLCPRAYGRFRTWLKRGMMPPSWTTSPKKKPESS